MDDNGLTTPGYTYQWIRVATDSTETDIATATASTYTLVTDDLGATIKVKVSFTDDASNAETLTSVATSGRLGGAATTATTPPTLTAAPRFTANQWDTDRASKITYLSGKSTLKVLREQGGDRSTLTPPATAFTMHRETALSSWVRRRQ